jgi:uncharacterized protein (TIGR02466 family)
MIKNLFGLPLYHTSLLNEKYNKNEILDVIIKNYNKDKNRNEWDKNNFEYSKIHHFLCDEENNFFNTPNFNSLIPIYEKHIINFLQNLNIKQNIKFSFKIVNYTCMKKDQQMRSHIHTNCNFSAIHYLNFDENFNDSTLFFNPASYSKFLNVLMPNISNFFNSEDEKNSWFYYNFKFSTKEEDLIIFPSILEHSVPVVKSDKYRVTISFNINLESL